MGNDAVALLDEPAVDDEPIELPDAKRSERTGRRWLLWSFIFCPCHLPLTMGALGVIFGGSAFGALIASNMLWVGIVCGTLYAIGLAIGFRHLRRATAGIDCSTGSCELPN